MVQQYIQGLKKEFHGYNKATFCKDVVAGLTVTAVALPLALAFGVSSGVTAASGLITAIIAGLMMSATGGGFYQISGPTGTMTAILILLGSQYGMQGIFMAGFMSGVMLLLAGVFRLGKLTAFIPMPVITGFTSGIAITIAMGQIDNFFGVTSQGVTAIEKIFSYITLGFSPHLVTMAIAVATVLLMVVFPPKWNAVVPSSLVALILATSVSVVLGLDTAVVGEMPTSLLLEDRLDLMAVDWTIVPELIGPAASIAMLVMIESLLCGASAGKMTGVHLQNDVELISKGVGNMIVPFFGGIPATAALARTSFAIRSGAQTRVTGIVHGVGLLVSMLVLAPAISQIPLSALAGVLIITAWRMNDWESIGKIFRGHFKGATAKYMVTMLATIIFDLTTAIAAGVALSLLFLTIRLSKLDITYSKVDMARMGIKDGDLIGRHAKTMVVYIAGAMIFANGEQVEAIEEELGDSDTVLFSMRGVSELDLSNGQTLYDLIERLHTKGIDVMFCGLSGHVTTMMSRTHIDQLVGENSIYWSAEYALRDIRPKREEHTTA